MSKALTHKQHWGSGDDAVITIIVASAWVLAFVALALDGGPCAVPVLMLAMALLVFVALYALAVDLMTEGGSDGPVRRRDPR